MWLVIDLRRNFKWKRREWLLPEMPDEFTRDAIGLHTSDFQTNKSVSITREMSDSETHANMHGYCVCWRVCVLCRHQSIRSEVRPTAAWCRSRLKHNHMARSFRVNALWKSRCKTSACGRTVVHTMPMRMTFKRMNLTNTEH